eukprot:610118-Alexandrium_andersonii.AAC.1
MSVKGTACPNREWTRGRRTHRPRPRGLVDAHIMEPRPALEKPVAGPKPASTRSDSTHTATPRDQHNKRGRSTQHRARGMQESDMAQVPRRAC